MSHNFLASSSLRHARVTESAQSWSSTILLPTAAMAEAASSVASVAESEHVLLAKWSESEVRDCGICHAFHSRGKSPSLASGRVNIGCSAGMAYVIIP